MGRALLIWVTLAAWPAAAAASSAVVLPRVEGDVSEARREEARALVTQILDAERWTVFDAAEVASRLPDDLASCGPDGGCAFEVRALLDADVVVGLTLIGEGDRVDRVRVVVIGSRGVAHRAEAAVDPEAGLPFAIAEPLRDALEVWATGNALPPAEPPHPVELEYEPAVRVERSPFNWFLGAFLIAGSAPMLGYGINSAARDGQCIEEGAGGACTERVRFQEGAGIFTGLGAAALIAGVVVLIAQPIPMFVRMGPESAGIEARGTF